MEYLISFLEGIVTFISPCLLPMIPIYFSYFAAGDEKSDTKVLKNSLGFVLGFTVVFVLMGALASAIGSFLVKYQTLINVVCGSAIVIFGLSFMGIFNLNIFKGNSGFGIKENMSFFSAITFGIVFSVGWTPCVGTFLGSALMLASHQGSVSKGIIMLLCYSLGLGIPFVFSAILIDKLKTAFDVIKRNYKTINTVCGLFLVIMGLAMIFGLMNKFFALVS